jgi:hypothetical protein
MMRARASLTCWILLVHSAQAAEPHPAKPLLDAVRAVKPEAIGSPAARTAWGKLVAAGPAVLPDLLDALDTPDTAVANWLRTAFDRIVEAELKNGGKRLEAELFLKYADDPRRQGRARRLALELADRLRPGTRDQRLPGWIDDPEFGSDAIDFELARLPMANLDAAALLTRYRQLFAAARDIEQARAIARKLKEKNVEVSVADHLGFLRHWLVVGPFPGNLPKGYAAVFPPEEKLDLAAEYTGKGDKPIRWQRLAVPEAATGRLGVVDLFKPLGEPEDAVGYAYTAFDSPSDQEVEFRGSADDNFQVWVNGRRVFGLEEYRNGLRIDRHRFRVPLRVGRNTVLVKVCQGKSDGGSADTTFEFVLRVCDPTGKGVHLANALPDR